MRILFVCLLSVVASTAVVGCAHGVKPADRAPQSVDSKAVAEIVSKSGSRVSGWVSFEKVAGGTLVRAEVKGLKAGGEHGFHVHEFGDCSAADAGSAGSHFNPTQKPHGGSAGDMRHTGDLENLKADKKGVAKYERTFAEGTLPVTMITGRSVLVHEKIDDLKTQPSGDSGKRIGCGVIGVGKVMATEAAK